MLVNDMVLLKGRLGRGGSVTKQEVGCFPCLVVDDESNVLFCLVVCRHVTSVEYLDVFVVCRCSGGKRVVFLSVWFTVLNFCSRLCFLHKVLACLSVSCLCVCLMDRLFARLFVCLFVQLFT